MLDRSPLGVVSFARLGLAALLLITAASTTACSSTPEGEEDEEAVTAAEAKAALTLNLLDIWAQPLPLKDVRLDVTRDGRKVRVELKDKTQIYLREPGEYKVVLVAPNHETAELTLGYDGTDSETGLKAAPTSRGLGVSVTHAKKNVNGKQLAAHEVFVGVRHEWFSAQGRPARRGNNVTLFMDGEEAWGSVHKALKSARSAVHVGTWWWESGFELVRNAQDSGATVEERWPNTILGTLESIPATKRVIVGQFWGQDSVLSWLNTDSKLRKYASAPNDAFEFMGQANETRGAFKFSVPPFNYGDRVRAVFPEVAKAPFDPEVPVASTVPSHDVDLSAGSPIAQNFVDGLLETASYHQKFMTIDSKVAYVGGMNLRQNDWDTSAHRVFEPRRMRPAATQYERLEVAASRRLPDEVPRKDYMVRVEGPSAQDVDDVFRTRWEFLRTSKVNYSNNTSPFEVKRDLPANPNGIQLQVTATLPAPFNEHAIAETWFNAVRRANKYILIEDQYFRIPLLNAAIVQRLRTVPDLKVVVITMPVTKTEPACAPSRQAYATTKVAFPDRVQFFQLRAFDNKGAASSAFVGLDVHAKLLVVDDTFLSIGSCNKNNRGIIYEGELNVAVADPAFVTASRKRIMSNMLGREAPEDWIGALVAQAALNDQQFATWSADNTTAARIKPEGFAYGLAYPVLDDCYLASIGPDRM